MPITDLFSSRNAKDPGDVWEYDRIPEKLRVQVYNLVTGALGTINEYSDYNALGIYKFISESVAHEHGRHSLTSRSKSNPADVLDCITGEREIPVWLDCVELSFRCIERIRGKLDDHGRSMANISIPAQDAVDEFNERFRRAGFGYRYEDGKLLRIDNELTHQQITRPALQLLADPRFKGADDEFRAAHDHYKAGEYKDCAVDALNALESTMKTICDLKKWSYPQGARSSDLLKILRREGLFPEFAEQSFDQLVATLKSGLPSLRNETGGHGQGAKPVVVPEYVATYALNLAASKIRFLVEAFKASSK
jgi:HEPN domain-containing protein